MKYFLKKKMIVKSSCFEISLEISHAGKAVAPLFLRILLALHYNKMLGTS